MKALLTGGSGFIGAYFHRDLAAAGHDRVTLDLIDPSGQAAQTPFVRGDVRDPDACRRALEDHGPIDVVVHLAAAHHDFGIERETYFSVNEHGTRTLTEAMDAAGVRNIVFYSTVAVYGSAPAPITEETPPAPESPYGESKLAGEKVLEEWVAKGDGRRALVIRPTVTFGPNNFANMYSLIRQIYSGKYLQFGEANNYKSLSYVENIVAATIELMQRPIAFEGEPAGSEIRPFEVFNYIDKPDLTSGGIAKAILESLGRKPKPLTIPYALGYAMGLPFDVVIKLTGKNLPISTARIHKLFQAQTKFESDKVFATGFVPPVSLREGIERMAKWYVERGQDEQAVWHLPPAEPVRTHTEAPAPTDRVATA